MREQRGAAAGLGWPQIVRLGLVQTALGSVVVLMTATLNRVMVVELALPAFVPGLLVALHYAVQVLRPRWGYGSDRSGRRTPWIVGGMAALCLGGFGAACGTADPGEPVPGRSGPGAGRVARPGGPARRRGAAARLPLPG